jgi:hypothetical protein
VIEGIVVVWRLERASGVGLLKWGVGIEVWTLNWRVEAMIESPG